MAESTSSPTPLLVEIGAVRDQLRTMECRGIASPYAAACEAMVWVEQELSRILNVRA